MKGRCIVAFIVFGIAAYSPAPIGDRGPLKVEAERGQDVVAQEQALYQGTQGPVGEVPMDTEQEYAGRESSDPDAAGALSAAQASGDEGSAAQVLREAARGMNDGRGFPWMWAVITLLLGFALVAALRMLANRIAPVPASFRGKPGR
ncbi:MAG: hypothetical protein HZC36_00210 [Armatimonadetes bacterium]|nr:hypothetical protein [Armatimonadota bacterium]